MFGQLAESSYQGEANSQSSSLTIRTLGALEIRWLGQPVTGLDSRKAQALLIYLALNRGPQERSHLAGLLWGERPETHARRNLRHALWSLRRQLDADLFHSDRLQVGLNPDFPGWVDALAFAAGLVKAARCRQAGELVVAMRHLRQAVDLYVGDFLADFDLAGSPDFEHWVVRRRAWLHQQAFDACAELTTYHSRRGEYAWALEYARRQVTLEPWWEEGNRQLIQLLALTGQRSAALAHYERFRQILAVELGIEPMEEMSALVERIRAAPASSAPPSLPERAAAVLPFVGREAQHARLVAGWELARQGQGRLTLIEGEAGVGKTRLADEVLRYAAAQGATILRGRCYEFGDSIPYQSIVDALRGYLRSLSTPPPPASPSPVWLAELSRLLPELRDWLPDLPAPLKVSGEATRQRLFEAVARFLKALTENPAGPDVSNPLILFLDDLHWADATILDLLHYLVRQLHAAPIWIVGAYRPEELRLSHPLTRLRQGLSRDDLVDLLPLAPLFPAAVAEIARSLVANDDSGDALGDYLYRESEGNPFVLVETVYSLQEQGALHDDESGIPRWDGPPALAMVSDRVQDLILQRVGRLSAAAQRLLILAAVIGRQFDTILLRAAAARDDTFLAESLEEWLDHHLVRPEPASPGQYDFSHNKIRAVVYRAADTGKRRYLHRQVGKALEQTLPAGSGEAVGLLAYHWDQAGKPAKAITYLIRAGDQARMLYAQEKAVAYYRRALDYLRAQGEYERAGRILMKLGLTYHNAFDFQQARLAYDEAFALWQRAASVRSANAPCPTSRPLRARWLEPVTLDPALAPDAHTDCLIAHLFSGLVELTPEMDIAPDIARTWEVLEGGCAFIFHLRDDVRWSDGMPVTAEDFEFAWKRVLDPATGSQAASFLYDLKGGRAFHCGEGPREAVGVRALDDITLLVELEGPVGYFPQLLTHVTWYPAPRHAVEARGAAWAEMEHLVSNGPFRLTAWRPGESMTLTRNLDYHGQFCGNLQQVQLLPVTDWSIRLAMYEAGDLDLLGITFFSAVEREEVRQRHLDEYIARPRLETYFLAFDVRRPPFDDVRVRRAFVMATDRERLADVVLRGYVAPATGGLTPPGMPGHVPDIAPPYDPDQARRLLAQAGYPAGQGFPPIDVLAYQAVAARNEFLQAQWREILGVVVQVEVVDWAAFLTRLGHQPYHLVNLSWVADYPDPDSLLRVSRTRGWPGWRHESYERLMREARGLTDLSQRMERYRQVEEILAQEAPILPLIYERDHLLVKPWVRSYPMSAIKPAFWKDVVMA